MLLLVALGILLRSVNQPQTNFTFTDTLGQIGLGYPLLFFLGLRSQRVQWVALVVLLIGYWGAFALYPAPATDFDYQSVAVPADWPHHYTGWMSHWNKNSNLAAAFDGWFLNLFPRNAPFVSNNGGYATLSFIPTLATMILGLIAGGWLRNDGSATKRLSLLFGTGCALLALGFASEQLGLCPIVKRIWTPAWTLYSGGWCFLILTVCHLICDVGGYVRAGRCPWW